MIYLGTPGQMVGIKCPSTQQVTASKPINTTLTLEGKVKAQVAPGRPRRTWALGLSDATRPEQHAMLQSFTDGAWGAGPFVFIPADAPVTNLLTPDQSSCDPALIGGSTTVPGGPVRLPDGWEPRSLLNTDPGALLGFGTNNVPVLQGQLVTVSAWVLGAGARVRMIWLTADGTHIYSQDSEISSDGVSWVRSFVTGMPPANAAMVQIQAVNTVRATRPCATWTDRLYPYSAGEGCQKAVVHGLSKDLIMAGPRIGQQYANASFTVTEVG